MNSLKTKTRPDLLTWLCIGSASFGVLWIIMFVVLVIFSIRGNVPPGLFPGIVIEYLQAGYLFISAEILLTAIGLVGIVLMWYMKKSGLYLYAVMKALIYFLPVLFIGSNHLTFLGLILPAILIVMYGIIFSDSVKK